MTQRQLQKWHGAGNDFLVDVCGASDATFWTAQRASAACHRHLGVGADGLIVAIMNSDALKMVLFNADGSVAEMSGNGIRCMVAAVNRATNDHPESRLVTTDAGIREVHLSVSAESGSGSVSMGRVTIEQPLPGSLGVARVGNPHVVVLDQPTWTIRQREDMAGEFSAAVGGANVEFATISSRDHVEIVVVERGVGWTLACGTGSVATAAVLQANGLIERRVTVTNPGGDLVVELLDDHAMLYGPVQFVADVTWEVD